jgi:hypothetical protein
MSNNIEKYNSNNYNLDGMIEDQSKFVRSTSCKLCNSSFRLECEELWEKTNNINAVYRLLESKGEKISYPSIRSHIINHYKKQENLDKLSNYVKSLDSWRKCKVEKEQRLELIMSILEKRIIEIAAEQDGNSDDSGRKMADTMVKLIQQLLSCQSALDEHKQLMEPVKLIVSRLQAIVKEEIQTHSGKDVKSALINVVSSLEKDVHEIMKNGK